MKRTFVGQEKKKEIEMAASFHKLLGLPAHQSVRLGCSVDPPVLTTDNSLLARIS